MKTCSKCKTQKPRGEFTKSKSRKDGLQPWCAICRREADKAYRNSPAGQEVKRERGKAYRSTTKGKESNRKSSKAYQKTPKGKEVQRNCVLKKLYGITSGQYDQMLKAQKGVCKICGTDAPGGRGRFHVDHDHINGEVRGLLCNECNRGLSAYKDNVTLLAKAIQYLSATF